jgi:hypothetical protein
MVVGLSYQSTQLARSHADGILGSLCRGCLCRFEHIFRYWYYYYLNNIIDNMMMNFRVMEVAEDGMRICESYS